MRILAALTLMLTLFLPTAASAQEAPTKYTEADLPGTWLFTFTVRGQPVACILDLTKTKGKGECKSSGAAGQSAQRIKGTTAIVGLLAFGMIEGTLDIREFDLRYTMKVRMSPTKSTMEGLLFTENMMEFYPLAVTRWSRE